MPSDATIRPGEIVVPLPDHADAGLYFIGRIHTPWKTREACPRRGDPDGPDCRIQIDARWTPALEGLASSEQVQVLYWLHESRRDLVVQTPRHTGKRAGTFALRSPARPNPIGSSVAKLISVEGNIVTVRGLDCVSGTPVIDLKPHHG